MTRKDTVKIAVVGAGAWGPNLVRNFHQRCQARVEWIVEKDPARRLSIAAKYPDIKTTLDFSEVLINDSVDAVVIATPTESHYELCKAALNCGKHVLVEKPLCTDFEEALELEKLAKKQRLILMCGHVFLFHPAIPFIKKLLGEQALGEIYYLHSTRTNFGPIRGDVNALWDLASHDIAIFLHLLGQNPVTVSAEGASFINPPIEDVVFGNCRFANGIVAKFHVSWLDPKKVRKLVIVGSQKMLQFDDMAPMESCIRIYDNTVDPQSSSSEISDTIHGFRQSIFQGGESVPEISPGEPLLNECEAFLEAIHQGHLEISNAGFAVRVVKVLEDLNHCLSSVTLSLKVTIKEGLRPALDVF